VIGLAISAMLIWQQKEETGRALKHAEEQETFGSRECGAGQGSPRPGGVEL